MKTPLHLSLAVAAVAFLPVIGIAADPSPSPSPGPAATSTATEVHDPNNGEALRPLLGKRVTLEGTIAKASEGKSGTVRYLNFSNNYRSSVSLVLFLNTPGASEFTMEKLQEFVGKKVRVTGILDEHQKTLQIKIDGLSQIEVQ